MHVKGLKGLNKKKIGLFFLIVSLVASSLVPALAWTFKGTTGEMDMAGYETHYRTFYSNHSNKYYMIFGHYDVATGYSIQYSHSNFGYDFAPSHTLLNNSDYSPMSGWTSKNAFALYLETNGQYLHIARINATNKVWYWKLNINATTGQIYNMTNEAQLVLDGAGWEGSWEARDELSIVVNADGYPYLGAECFSGGQNSYFVWESPTNDGTWATETFAWYNTMDSEWIDNGGGNPPNAQQGGNLVPGAGNDIIVLWWWSNAPFYPHASMVYDASADDWIQNQYWTYDGAEGDWAFRSWGIGYNVEANRTIMTKTHENNPDGVIGLEAQIMNYSNGYSVSATFQVGFDDVGDAGSVEYNPFVSINAAGAANFYWYITGNATVWARRMNPNGTMEANWFVTETAEFLLEDWQFSAIPGINDDKPSGIFWMDDIGTLQVSDMAYYDTELLFLGSNFSFPAEHLNTTLYHSDGAIVEDGDWIFEGEVYDLVSFVDNATSFYVNTSDSRHEILFRWDNETQEQWINVDPADQFTIGLAHSEFERTGNVTRLLWRFIPDRSIIDSVNNTWGYTIANSDMGFSLSADLGLETNIYNLGGKTYYAFTGDGGRVTGGHPFEIYATNGTEGSSARAEQIYRKLQSSHFLIEIDMDNEWDGGNGEFDIDPGVGWVDIGIDYRLNGTWELGHYVRLYVQDADVGHHNAGNDHNWVEWSVDWYNYDGIASLQNIASDLIYSNHWGYENENLSPDYHNRTSSQLWVDLWFDRTNSSTTIAGQVNAMYHGMREHGSAWWFGYGVFQPMVSDYGNAQFLDDLYDEGRNVTDSMKFDLMRVFVEVGKVADADGDDETWTIRSIENFNRKLADDRMQGIEQPAFEETLVLDMPMFQSNNPLIRAIDGVSVAIWKGALGFQKILWGALDSFFLWAGFGEGFFSRITAFVMTLPDIFIAFMEFMPVLLIEMADIIESVFAAIVLMIPLYSISVGTLAGTLIDYWHILSQLLNGQLVPFDIIRDIQIGDWINFGITMLPTYEILMIIFDDDPGWRAERRARFYSSLFGGMINFLKGMASFMQSIVQTIMEIIPG
jgi:hypothetical protein